MIFTIEKNDFLQHIAKVSKAEPTGIIRDKFNGTLIEASEDRQELKLLAYDGVNAIQVPVEATIEQHGSCVLSSRFLADVVAHMPKCKIRFEHDVDRQILLIQAEQIKYQIRTLDSSEYPIQHIPLPKERLSIKNIPELARITSLVAEAGDQNSDCVSLRFNSAGVRGVACRRSAHLVEYHAEKDSQKKEISVMVSSQALCVLGAITDEETSFELGVVGSMLVLFDGTIRFASALRPKEFPFDLQAIKDQFEQWYITAAANFDAKALQGVQVVNTGLPDSIKKGFLEISFDADNLVLTSHHELGSSVYRLPADISCSLDNNGEPFFYDHRLLLKILSQLSGEVRFIFLKDSRLMIVSEQLCFMTGGLKARPKIEREEAQDAAKQSKGAAKKKKGAKVA